MARTRRDPDQAGPKVDMQALMFLDIKGFSSLTEEQLRTFQRDILPRLAEITKRADGTYTNTWGDAIVCASPHTGKLCRVALALRDFFKNTHWPEHQMPSLTARISLHAGRLYVCA